MNLALDYTHGNAKEIKSKLEVIEHLIKFIIRKAYEKISKTIKDESLFIPNEIINIHNKIIYLVKMEMIEIERLNL
jgi:hypothetical protein